MLLLVVLLSNGVALAEPISLTLGIAAPPIIIDEEPPIVLTPVAPTPTRGTTPDKIILKPPTKVPENPEEIPENPEEVPENPEEVPENPEKPEQPEKIPDKVIEDYDEKSGIKITYPVDKNGNKDKTNYEIEVPKFPSIDWRKIFIPFITGNSSSTKAISNKFITLKGKVDQSNLYLLLELNSENHLVALQTDDDGNWLYQLPYKLEKGDHHLYLWSFFAGDSSLLSSLPLHVEGSIEDSENSEQVDVENVLNLKLDDSLLAPELKKSGLEKKLFYINGRLFNKDNILYPDDKLEFVIVITPVLNTFLDKVSLLDFEYLIYNDQGDIVQQFTDENKPVFRENILAFTKGFKLSDKEKLLPGDYTLIVKAKTQGLSYEMPFDFSVKLNKRPLQIIDNDIGDNFLKFLIMVLVLILSGYIYKKSQQKKLNDKN